MLDESLYNFFKNRLSSILLISWNLREIDITRVVISNKNFILKETLGS